MDQEVADTDISEDIEVHGNTVTSTIIGNEAPRKAKHLCNKDDNDIISYYTDISEDEQYFDTHSLIPNKGDSSMQNETLNIFLNELFNKKVDIKSNFNEQEILDIRTAVDEQVHLLADTIGEVDPRLRIREVIPVGSAREGTQIVRPCEYDYILILETLSQPGAVSLKFWKHCRKNMYVTLEDNEMRALFQGYIDRNKRINAADQFPRKGLGSLFLASVFRAVKLCTKRSVEKSTGILTGLPSKPKIHGPAFLVMFEWHGNTATCSATMKISVDLCPALEVDWREYKDSLQSIECDVVADYKHHIKNVGSVLLLPSNANLFKVTLTEAELLLTSELSEHHIKCYKLLKYIINGEPHPLQTIACKIKYKFQNNTFLPSYALKLIVWHHQFTQHCSDEKDLGFCVTTILQSCESYSQCVDILKHPLNTRISSLGFKLSNYVRGDIEIITTLITHKTFCLQDSCERTRRVLNGLRTIHDLSLEQYNFEKFCHKIAVSGLGRYYGSQYRIIYTVIVCLLFVSLFACTGYFALSEQEWQSTVLWIVGCSMSLIGIYGMNFYLSPNMLARSRRKCYEMFLLCFVYTWYITGLGLLVQSAHGLTFYLIVIIQGISLIFLNAVRIHCIHNRLKVFMKSEAVPERSVPVIKV